MDAQQLLKARYKLIAEYPFCDMPVGTVVTALDDDGNFELGAGKRLNAEQLSACNANFRRLKWWEERDAKDLPVYVTHTVSGKTGKVDKWDLKSAGSGGVNTGNSFWLLQYITPAREDDLK